MFLFSNSSRGITDDRHGTLSMLERVGLAVESSESMHTQKRVGLRWWIISLRVQYSRIKRDTFFFSIATRMRNCSMESRHVATNLVHKDSVGSDLRVRIEISPILPEMKAAKTKVCALLSPKLSCFTPLVLYKVILPRISFLVRPQNYCHISKKEHAITEKRVMKRPKNIHSKTCIEQLILESKCCFTEP